MEHFTKIDKQTLSVLRNASNNERYRRQLKASTLSATRLLVRYGIIAWCALLFLAIDAVQGNRSWALSLGPAQVHSSLGHPLAVTLELNHLKDISLDQLKVSQASLEYYEKMGIKPTTVPRDLKFSVKKDEQGKAILTISSSRRFTEPFLNFVVHIRWPKGELLKEVTLLLNPPKMAQ